MPKKRWMIASDIHGSALFCRRLLEQFSASGAERLLLLGDLLYHGPRNDLPEGYAPKEVIPLLNSVKNSLLCVRGNCDTEVDQMVLEFPILAEYAVLALGEDTIFVTHGHHFSEAAPPPHRPGDLLLCGHTHIPVCAEHGDYVYLNPGSVSIPKAGSCRSYMLWEDGVFTWHELDTGAEYCRWATR